MNTAVAGLGLMGTAIAERLLDAGHQVTVYNRTARKTEPLVERGAIRVSDASALWDGAEVVITMLSDSAALEEFAVGSGLLEAAGRRARTLIDMSTVSPEASARVAAAAVSAGVAYLRAPVSGNPAAVRGGNLGIVVSGSATDFDAMGPLLHDIGPNVFYLGEGEVARVMKLSLNLIVAGTAELLAESLRLGEAHGLRRDQMLEVIAGSAVGSPFVKYKTPALVAGDYSATFSTRLMLKDVDMAQSTAATVAAPLPVTDTVRRQLAKCVEAGFGDLDFMSLLPLLEL
jgi:3-hydroxyisobutyrate dehydrogenase-like beta-hydroxyacid dehydrogenase